MIKEFKPEFIIGSATEPAVMLGLKAKKIMYTHFPTELRMSRHSLSAEVYRSVYWWRHYKALSELNAIVCISEFTKTITWEAWRKSQPDKTRYSVIYPSVDTERLKNAMALQKDPYKICYVGRLHRDKGIDFVLDAFQNVKKEISEAKLEIVGSISGLEYFSDLKTRASKIDNVILKTNVPESVIVETLSTSQCMVSFNPDEHFGIVPIEAMALGCPPIVADGGGQRETVIHGETGFLAREPGEIEVYIHKLLTDHKLASYVSEKAIVHAEKFSRKSFAEKWIELFNIIR
jgi:glycosyltransferase involved in cell wall biosynthesis